MGWDIVFLAEFPTPEPAAARFRQIGKRLEGRPGGSELESFQILDVADPFRALIELGWRPGASGPATWERANELLIEHESSDVRIRATWRVLGCRQEKTTSGGVTVTAHPPDHRWDPRAGRPIDVVWDIGDSRRTTAGGRGDWPCVEESIAEVSLLVSLGATSIWGVDADRTIDPEHLFAVFHANPNDYHLDGFAHPSFPPHAISEEVVWFAAENLEEVRVLPTERGPLVHTRDLQRGRLSVFYAGMGGILGADVEGRPE
ncbi:MAG: hypothetical protein AAGF12_16390 [Myxococcota bacterium]